MRSQRLPRTSMFNPSFSRWLCSDFAGVPLLAVAVAAAATAAAGAAAPPSSADVDVFATSLLRGGMAGVREVGCGAMRCDAGMCCLFIARTLCSMGWSRGALEGRGFG